MNYIQLQMFQRLWKCACNYGVDHTELSRLSIKKGGEIAVLHNEKMEASVHDVRWTKQLYYRALDYYKKLNMCDSHRVESDSSQNDTRT